MCAQQRKKNSWKWFIYTWIIKQACHRQCSKLELVLGTSAGVYSTVMHHGYKQPIDTSWVSLAID